VFRFSFKFHARGPKAAAGMKIEFSDKMDNKKPVISA